MSDQRIGPGNLLVLSVTSDVYAGLFDEDLDGVADRLDPAIRSAADWTVSDK